MKIIRVFAVFVVVSLVIGLGYAFNGQTKSEVLEEIYAKQQENELKLEEQQEIVDLQEEIEKENIVVETVDIPEDLSSTTTTKKTSNTEIDIQQQKSTNDNQNKSSNGFITNSNIISSDSNYENKEIFEEQPKEQKTVVVDNSVDMSSLDYSSHKGRIDCGSSQECMNISLPIQFKFKQSITNSFYVDVMSNSGISLGYFIEYVFKENTYSNTEECEKIGNEIKQTLSDRVIGYQCIGSTLKINTDY